MTTELTRGAKQDFKNPRLECNGLLLFTSRVEVCEQWFRRVRYVLISCQKSTPITLIINPETLHLGDDLKAIILGKREDNYYTSEEPSPFDIAQTSNNALPLDRLTAHILTNLWNPKAIHVHLIVCKHNSLSLYVHLILRVHQAKARFPSNLVIIKVHENRAHQWNFIKIHRRGSWLIVKVLELFWCLLGWSVWRREAHRSYTNIFKVTRQ